MASSYSAVTKPIL